MDYQGILIRLVQEKGVISRERLKSEFLIELEDRKVLSSIGMFKFQEVLIELLKKGVLVETAQGIKLRS